MTTKTLVDKFMDEVPSDIRGKVTDLMSAYTDVALCRVRFESVKKKYSRVKPENLRDRKDYLDAFNALEQSACLVKIMWEKKAKELGEKALWTVAPKILAAVAML